MVYGYIRVSTEEQNLENQKKAIAELFAVDEWVEEKRSGTVDYSKRSLGALVEKTREGDVLVVTELSRLGRSLAMIFDIVSALKKKGSPLRCHKEQLRPRPVQRQRHSGFRAHVRVWAFGAD